MATLKRSEMRIFDDAFQMHGGYVLDFSDRTFAEFFEDEFGVDIGQEKYRVNGSSKARRFRAFLQAENEHTVARVARLMWQRRESLPQLYDVFSPETAALKTRFFDLVSRMEGTSAVARTDAIELLRLMRRSRS